MTTNIDEILNAILDITDLDDLKRVYDAIDVRRESLAHEHASGLRVGDRVRLEGISPKYLEGLTGVIASVPRGKSVPIRPDYPESTPPRFLQEDGTVHAPAGSVRVIERASEQASASGEDSAKRGSR